MEKLFLGNILSEAALRRHKMYIKNANVKNAIKKRKNAIELFSRWFKIYVEKK